MNVLRLLSMTFVFLKVFGDSLRASKPDVTHISFFRNALVGSNITLMLFLLSFGLFCRLEKGRILYGLAKNI